jgi:hypothetical protein
MMRRQPGGAHSSLLALLQGRSGGLLLGLSALRAAELFTRQFLMKGLATIDTNLAAFIFSAHALIVASRGSTWQKSPEIVPRDASRDA